MSDFSLHVQPTPNPKALKFVTNVPLSEGRFTIKYLTEVKDYPLLKAVLGVSGVDTIFVADNYITVTKFAYKSWDEVEPEIAEQFKNYLQSHVPYKQEIKEKEYATPELKEIDAVLDKHIRPGLQGDGGDLNVLEYTDNVLYIRYQGACSACPSSTTGTLMAIKTILQENYNEDIDVQIR